MQLILDDPGCFDTLLAHYGWFEGVRNYIAIVGDKSLPDLDELGGYYGEKVVIEAQRMGLNTCWVGLSYRKIGSVLDIAEGEKLVCVISVGYGATQGVDHKRKYPGKVSKTDVATAPEWYKRGVACALLAPTAINQQKFKFTLHEGNKVSLKAGFGPYAKVDLGIVKYHFELGAGVEKFEWI